MPGENLLSHCQALRDDPEFRRWDTSDYIPIRAIEAPAGLPWGVVLSQVDDAPPAEDAVVAAHAALAQPDRRMLAILGPPFSGQTSAMRRLAWQLAEHPARGSPVFVDLARYAAQPAGGLRLCRTIAEAAGAYVPALAPAMDDLLSQAAPQGGPALTGARIVFILDGLEAVQRQLRDGLASELLDILGAPHLAAHRFVLSCRYEDLPPALSARARRLLLQYLSGREVLRYLRVRRGSAAQANARFGQILDAQLLDLTALPPLLADILQRLEDRHSGTLTRNQLLQDSLEAQIAGLPATFQRGDAARQSLIALAWEMSWRPDESLDINRVFAILSAIRRERGYSLEDFYDQLCAAGMLRDVDRRRATFQRPGQRAYCAALALLQRLDLGAALDDLLPQCAVVERQARWEAVLVGLSGMLPDHTPLLRIVQAARSTNNGLYMVMLARCLQSLPRGMFEQLAPRERGALLDACAAWADPAREPSALRRAQIAESLGCLPDATSVRALLRLSCERIRPAISRRLDYEYTSVRLSAALGLRNLMLFRPPTHPAGAALWQNVAPETKAALQAWVAAGGGAEASLRLAAQAPGTPLEARIIALIALADLAADGPALLFLLRQIIAPPPLVRPDDGEALIRTAADALTLCDARRVAALIGHLLRHPPPLSDAAVGQLIYLVGRVRAHDPGCLRWLAGQLADHADPQIKAKALRSLAWIVGGAPPLALDGAPLGPALLAAARQLGRGQLADLALPAPLGDLRLAGCAADDPGIVYLRRTALECLRWLPGDTDFAGLAAEAEAWPIDLRRALSRSAALRDRGAK